MLKSAKENNNMHIMKYTKWKLNNMNIKKKML